MSGEHHTSVLHVLASSPYGGLESVVKMLTSGLVRRGHACHVAAIVDPQPDPHPFESVLAAAGVPVTAIRLGGRAYIRERQALADVCRAQSVTLLHSHGFRADIQTLGVGRRLGLPVVSTVHGFTGGDWKMKLYEALQERSLRRAAAVIAVSRPIVTRLATRGVPGDRIHWIANAWEPASAPAVRAQAREELQIPAEARIIGWVGRLSHEKGPDVLIDALTSMPGEASDAIACVVGGGPELEALRQQAARLGLSDRVRLVGPRPEAARLFAAFDLFCLSSRTEGTPMSVLEAMGAEVPIVATRVGGVSDVVDESQARLVTSEDPIALGAALAAALADPADAALRAQNARARLDAEFGVDSWLERHEALYAELS